MHSFNRTNGFTLIELMVTVAIIAILAAIAMPSYNSYVTRSKIAEATSELSKWRNAVERYYQDNRNYTGVCASTSSGIDAKYFSYSCESTAQTYTLTATGVTAQGMSGYAYTLNHNNEKRTTQFANEASTATCWLTKKGGC
ncbi:MAG TPA: type IV pilin protein [Methylophilaceae bacterium]|nr:type IV pilin protein [Methylophilaceae bacterium]